MRTKITVHQIPPNAPTSLTKVQELLRYYVSNHHPILESVAPSFYPKFQNTNIHLATNKAFYTPGPDNKSFVFDYGYGPVTFASSGIDSFTRDRLVGCAQAVLGVEYNTVTSVFETAVNLDQAILLQNAVTGDLVLAIETRHDLQQILDEHHHHHHDDHHHNDHHHNDHHH